MHPGTPEPPDKAPRHPPATLARGLLKGQVPRAAPDPPADANSSQEAPPAGACRRKGLRRRFLRAGCSRGPDYGICPIFARRRTSICPGRLLFTRRGAFFRTAGAARAFRETRAGKKRGTRDDGACPGCARRFFVGEGEGKRGGGGLWKVRAGERLTGQGLKGLQAASVR